MDKDPPAAIGPVETPGARGRILKEGGNNGEVRVMVDFALHLLAACPDCPRSVSPCLVVDVAVSSYRDYGRRCFFSLEITHHAAVTDPRGRPLTSRMPGKYWIE